MTILEKRLNEFKKRQNTLKGNYTSQIINLERRIREENKLIEKINKTKKSKLIVLGIMLIVLWFVSGIVYYVFAEDYAPLTEIEQINKSYAENTIKNEINYNNMWEYVESMTYQEWANTFCAEKYQETMED